jgi:hypothetical protein
VLLLLLVPHAYSSESDDKAELYEFLSSESPASAKLFDFLSDVVGLDLTKYGVVPPEVVPPGFEGLSPLEFYKKISEYASTLPPPNFTLPDQFGGLVEEESSGFDFEYNGTNFGTMCIFYNGHMNTLKLYYYGEEDFVYAEPQPPDILSRAKLILQRYQTFFQKNYGKDAPYLLPMLDILNSVDDLTPMEITEGNVTFQVTEVKNETRIKWIYTEGGVVMERKRVDIDFRHGAFESFHDTWGLYNVSGLSEISSEEAYQIALEAANNCTLRIGYENGTIKTVKVPDLSNAFYQDSFSMLPFRYQESHIPSRIERDPLTLYPYWQFWFYFNESIARNDGVQVGVWGDTGEIIYCSGFGYYGIWPPTELDTPSQPPDDQPSEEESQPNPDDQLPEEQSQLTPHDQPVEEQNQLFSADQVPEEEKQPNTLDPSTLAVAASLVAVTIISISAIALYRKNRHK